MAKTTKVLSYSGLSHYDEKIKEWTQDYVEENAPRPDLSNYLTATDISTGTELGTIDVKNEPVCVQGLSNQNGKLKIDGLIINGDLTVKGTTTTENSIDSIIEGAVTVVNGGAVESTSTFMGQVILTGAHVFIEGMSFSLRDTLTGSRSFTCDNNIRFQDSSAEIGSITSLTWDADTNTLLGILDNNGDTIEIYSGTHGGWIRFKTQYDTETTFQTMEAYSVNENSSGYIKVSEDVYDWFVSNAESDSLESVTAITKEAYGILYDPSTEAIRLGRGVYDSGITEDVPGYGFQFYEGEGEPIAVRDLNAEDDGALVMWDAENYRLVAAPSLAITDEEGITAITSDTGISLKAGEINSTMPQYAHADFFQDNLRLGVCDPGDMIDKTYIHLNGKDYNVTIEGGKVELIASDPGDGISSKISATYDCIKLEAPHGAIELESDENIVLTTNSTIGLESKGVYNDGYNSFDMSGHLRLSPEQIYLGVLEPADGVDLAYIKVGQLNNGYAFPHITIEGYSGIDLIADTAYIKMDYDAIKIGASNLQIEYTGWQDEEASITLGETTITETQLQQLLAILTNNLSEVKF